MSNNDQQFRKATGGSNDWPEDRVSGNERRLNKLEARKALNEYKLGWCRLCGDDCAEQCFCELEVKLSAGK